MSFESFWPATEERLCNEAESLGDLLAMLQGRVHAGLIGEMEWNQIAQRVRHLPVTVAAFPFGFELPMHEAKPRADFGISGIGGSRAGAYFEQKGRAGDADPVTRGVARLLWESEPEDSPLRRVAGRKMLLEYDIDSTGTGRHPDPGIFLYPAEGVLVGDGSPGRARDARLVLEAIASSTGLGLADAQREHVQRVYMAMRPNTSLRAIGAFPSRNKGFRLAITGCRTAGEVSELLGRAGWPGQLELAASSVYRFERQGVFDYLGVHLDVTADGLAPSLGISFYSREGEWLRDIQPWVPLIDSLREEPIVIDDKLSALAETSCGAETLFGKSAPFALMRGIHHLKIGLSQGRIEHVKAYIFLLMIGAPRG